MAENKERAETYCVATYYEGQDEPNLECVLVPNHDGLHFDCKRSIQWRGTNDRSPESADARTPPNEPECNNHFSDGTKIFPNRECPDARTPQLTGGDAEALRLLDEWIAVERYATVQWGLRTEQERERYRTLKGALESRVIAIGTAAREAARTPVPAKEPTCACGVASPLLVTLCEDEGMVYGWPVHVHHNVRHCTPCCRNDYKSTEVVPQKEATAPLCVKCNAGPQGTNRLCRSCYEAAYEESK